MIRHLHLAPHPSYTDDHLHFRRMKGSDFFFIA